MILAVAPDVLSEFDNKYVKMSIKSAIRVSSCRL